MYTSRASGALSVPCRSFAVIRDSMVVNYLPAFPRTTYRSMVSVACPKTSVSATIHCLTTLKSTDSFLSTHSWRFPWTWVQSHGSHFQDTLYIHRDVSCLSLTNYKDPIAGFCENGNEILAAQKLSNCSPPGWSPACQGFCSVGLLTIIRHQLYLDRPVAATSNSIFRCLPASISSKILY